MVTYHMVNGKVQKHIKEEKGPISFKRHLGNLQEIPDKLMYQISQKIPILGYNSHIKNSLHEWAMTIFPSLRFFGTTLNRAGPVVETKCVAVYQISQYNT